MKIQLQATVCRLSYIFRTIFPLFTPHQSSTTLKPYNGPRSCTKS
jgi:hypothetical protein